MKNVNAKIIRRLYLNQLVIAIFGVVVITASSFMGGVLVFGASLLAMGLYLFLVYDAMWNAGAKAAARRLSAEDAQLEKIKTPALIALFASAFNLANAVIYAVAWGVIYADDAMQSTANANAAIREAIRAAMHANQTVQAAGEEVTGGIVLLGDAIHLIMHYVNGMYIGIQDMLFPHPFHGLPNTIVLDLPSPIITELTAPWFFFLIPVPLFAVGILAYYLGASETKLSTLLSKLGEAASGNSPDS